MRNASNTRSRVNWRSIKATTSRGERQVRAKPTTSKERGEELPLERLAGSCCSWLTLVLNRAASLEDDKLRGVQVSGVRRTCSVAYLLPGLMSSGRYCLYCLDPFSPPGRPNIFLKRSMMMLDTQKLRSWFSIRFVGTDAAVQASTCMPSDGMHGA